MESTMMIADDHHDDQHELGLVLGEEFQPPAVVNVDVSEDLLAAHINRDKKNIFGCQCGCRIALFGP